MSSKNHLATAITMRVGAFIKHNDIDMATVKVEQLVKLLFNAQLQQQGLLASSEKLQYRLQAHSSKQATSCEICGQLVDQLFTQSCHPEPSFDGSSKFLPTNPLYSVISGHQDCLRATRIQHPSNLELVCTTHSGTEISIYRT